ncbi:hypothetical protein BS17DRAFT_788122 [Gyrodon lividus]|nr:hypothetical protein BS17DRAFT_788122 [Gyrodon lividus]
MPSLYTELLAGRSRLSSFADTSQFGVEGVSACGLAALNFARVVFRIEQNKGNISDVLNEIDTRETVEEIISICAGWSSDLHLEVENIYRLPLFDTSLELLFTNYGVPRSKHFKHVLQDMQRIQTSAVMIITRPPEIIACFKLADPGTGRTVFVVFDSHPRPSHPYGAGLFFSASVEQTALMLSNILPVDEDLLASSAFQWQAQLLSNYSGHIFVASNHCLDTEACNIKSSLAMLAARAEIEEFKRRNKLLGSENEWLETKANRLKDAMRQVRMKGKQTTLYAQKAAELSRPMRSFGGECTVFVDDSPPVPATEPPMYNLDHELAERMAIEDLENGIQGLTIARQFQNQYDAEDQELRRQHEELTSCMRPTFKCVICLDEQPEDDVAKVDDCSHMLCRSCLREFVCSKIQEHRFPILCPLCTAIDHNPKPAVISRFLVEQLGITEEQYRVWTEMELAEFSVLIQCRKCNGSAFVDRQDHEEMSIVMCPEQDCDHVWCKACQQTVVTGGPKHSCDGTSELDHLMKEKGWKYCPNCKTPIQQESGCNHMTVSPPSPYLWRYLHLPLPVPTSASRQDATLTFAMFAVL